MKRPQPHAEGTVFRIIYDTIEATKHCKTRNFLCRFWRHHAATCRRNGEFPTPESHTMSNDLQVDSGTLAKMLINSYEMVNLMADYASRYGYLLGGLEMIAAGQATADKVLEAFHKKYDTTTDPSQSTV